MIATSISTSRRWTSRLLTAFSGIFLLFDAAMKVLKLPPAIQGTVDLGYPASTVVGIGVLLLCCVVTFLVPRTSFLGAVLLTGYLGGAVASQVRVGNPLFSHVLFPVYVAAMVWGGLYLRDDRLRTMLFSFPARAHP